MKVLLDTCVPGKVQQELEVAGYEVVWVGNWSQDPGDTAILEYAYKERYILVTLDKDFGELAVVHGREHSGILRLVGVAAEQQGKRCLEVLGLHAEALLAGALVTATANKIRVRPPTNPL